MYMKNNEKEIKSEITKVLVELGVPINLQGFKYFRQGIYIAVASPVIMDKVTHELYPQVGNCFQVKPTVVERCMRHASDQAYNKTHFRCLYRYFGFSEPMQWNYKPSNSELIALVAEYIRMHIDEEMPAVS